MNEKILILVDVQHLNADESAMIRKAGIFCDTGVILGGIMPKYRDMIFKALTSDDMDSPEMRFFGVRGNHDEPNVLSERNIYNIHANAVTIFYEYIRNEPLGGKPCYDITINKGKITFTNDKYKHGIPLSDGTVNRYSYVNFTVAGFEGSHFYNGGAYQYTQDETVKIAATIPEADVLFSHDCAYGSPVAVSDDIGLKGIAEYIKTHNPKYHIHSHNQNAEYTFGKTKTFCVHRCALFDYFNGTMEAVF